MFIVPLRSDMPRVPVLDLEPVSTRCASSDPPGQTCNLKRPDAVALQVYLDGQSLVADADDIITASAPVGGPVDLSSATIKGVSGLSGASATQVAAIQRLLGVYIVETDVAIKSFLYGNLSKYRNSAYTPDPNRLPASAAIAVVADDGVTPYTFAVPTLSSAAINTPTAGALRITGSGFTALGLSKIVVKLYGPVVKDLTSDTITSAGGSVTSTQIDVPASLVVGVAAGFSSVRVRVNDILSNNFAVS